MRWLFSALTFLFFQPLAHTQPWVAQNEEEALFIRRIADFWQEGEYQIVKKEIEDFLKDYPNSSFTQSLSATLGDLYVREKNHQGALMQYARITDPEITDRIFFNRMQCLLDLQWYATLSDECENFLAKPTITADQKLRATYLLAIALYQQCLDTEKDSESLKRLAERAQPHFELLLHSELSREVAQAFAHLSCILKDYVSASKIYLQLAQQENENRGEMLFQAALLQAEFDKSLAMQTFIEVSKLNHPRASDALYNHLVLSYDTGKYREVLSHKAEILAQIPSERQGAAHLFFGRSHLQLKEYGEALQELSLFSDTAAPSEMLRLALIDMLEAAYQQGDEPILKQTIDRISALYPEEKQLPKAFLAHALLLKKSAKFDDALDELKNIRTRFSASLQVESALFEQLQIEFQQKRYVECRALCREYLQQFDNPDLMPFVWRYLASSSQHLATLSSNVKDKENLSDDLQILLRQDQTLSTSERNDWSFLFAKTNYELSRYAIAIPILEQLLANDTAFHSRANATFLLGLCYRDGKDDFEGFCQKAEEALANGADLIDPAAQHIALFNGYLACKKNRIDLAAEHMFEASKLSEIQPENLLWLADYYFGKIDSTDPNRQQNIERSFIVLEKYLALSQVDLGALTEFMLSFESAIIKLAKLYGYQNQMEKQLNLLESLKKQIGNHPTWAWKEESQIDLQLANCYAQSGRLNQALQLFDQVIEKNPTVRSFVSASAALQSARLRIAIAIQKKQSSDHPDVIKLLSNLKSLALQKTLINEPIHLEAALEYVDFQTGLEKKQRFDKKLALLTKMKSGFTSTDDLLSRDYQNSRKSLPEKDRIYDAYMQLLDAQILCCQMQLSKSETERREFKQAAEKLLQEILTNPLTDFLASKAREQQELLNSK